MNSEQNTVRTRRLAFLIPLAGFLVLAGFASLALLATLRGERDMTQLPSAMVGKPAPAVALPDLRDAGSTVSVLSEEIEIFGIAYKDKPEDTRGFLATYGDPFAGIGIDRDGDAGMSWGVYGVPETFLIDASGTIILRHAGPIDRRVLDELLRPAIRDLAAGTKP